MSLVDKVTARGRSTFRARSWFPGGSATESEHKGVVELERGARATPVRGLGVGVTGPSLQYGLDSTQNWDNDGEYLQAGLSWNRKKDVLPVAQEV